MTDRKFYRTVLQVEVLSETPYECTELEEVHRDIVFGDCSGQVTEIVRNEEVDGARMAQLLDAQGSDPAFFNLTEDGEDAAEREP